MDPSAAGLSYRWLAGVGSLVLGLGISGCSSEDGAPGNASGGSGASAGAGGSAGLAGAAGAGGQIVRPTDMEAETARAACQYASGALPAATLGVSDPVGGAIPVEHVLVLMMENRSFDHYLSKLPEYGQPDVDVADQSFENPDATGQMVPFQKTSEYCVRDPDHGWSAVHEQFNDGKMDGFVTSNGADGARAMGYLDQNDIPFYYDLYNTFAIGDRYFCSMLGPTWPNRMYLYSGSSHTLVKNTLPTSSKAQNVFQMLIDKGVEWKVYRKNLAPAAMFFETWLSSISGCGNPDSGDPCRVGSIDELLTDLAAGKLPPVTFIDPEFSSGITQTSEHPPGNPQYGQQFVWSVVDALTKSPLWPKSALFLTYDEHGGFADHVVPPPACDPGTGDPEDATLGKFDRYGIRVPVAVISPFAKKHFVSHRVYDHTSILRFIQARFGLPAISNRDANADAMMEMFDFQNPPFMTPPTFSAPPLDPGKVAECEQAFP